MEKETILNCLNKILDFEITNDQKKTLISYYDCLIEYNKIHNLTTITEFNDVVNKHYCDSLFFTKKIQIKNQKIVDVGTGAGFPGIVLKIIFPEIELHLIESNNKKVKFLEFIIKKLNLNNVFIWNKRCEDVCQIKKEYFDICISRAMAPLNILLELCCQLIKIGGKMIALKGKKYKEEIKRLKIRFIKFGFNEPLIQEISDIKYGFRANLFYDKIKKADDKYPRNYSIIKRESLEIEG